MLKKLFFIAFSLSSYVLVAQDSGIIHIVKSGETITQIANFYKIKAKDIYTYNQLDKNGYIKVGQKLNIPKTVKNTAKKESLVTTTKRNNGSFHIIEPGETLYKISKDHNVSIQQLRDLNNLQNDNIKLGDTLFFSKQKNNAIVVSNNPEKVAAKSIQKNATINDSNKLNDNNIESKLFKNTESFNRINEVGVFEKQFKQTSKSVTGLCGTFKTISGWKDKKYYALMNDAVNGSVVKVKVDDKVIYAKVLGPLPDIKDDGSLMIRISNAAAAALGVHYDLFEVKVEQP